MTTNERTREALRRVQNPSERNFGQVIAGFMAKGIPQDQISPKENCFTFWAWKGLGYSVRKGEHGVKVTTWIPIGGKAQDDQEEGKKAGMRFRPKTTTVFHVSQVEPITEGQRERWHNERADVIAAKRFFDAVGSLFDEADPDPEPTQERGPSALESSRMAEMRRLAGVR